MVCGSRVLVAVLVFSLIITSGCCSGSGRNTNPSSGNSVKPGGAEASSSILSDVPDLLQNSSYTCGATALRAVLLYWGTDIPEDTLVAMLSTTNESGTPPQNIVNTSGSLGYPAEIRTGLSLTDLESLIRAGFPVIIGMEEHRNQSRVLSEEQGKNLGHWMVVIGFDTDNVWLEDPAVLGKRTVLPRKEFLTRWQIAGKDIRTPDALTVTRMAIVIRGDGADIATRREWGERGNRSMTGDPDGIRISG